MKKKRMNFYENLDDNASNDKDSGPFDKYIDKFEK